MKGGDVLDRTRYHDDSFPSQQEKTVIIEIYSAYILVLLLEFLGCYFILPSTNKLAS